MKTLPALLVAAALCAGCVGSLLESGSDPPDVYRLAGPAVEDRGETLPLAISIGRPRAAASLDTDRIAVVQAGLRFDYVAAVRWSEPAPQMLQQLVVRAVVADGRFATVVAAPSRVPSDLLLDVELRRFEAVYAAGDAPPTATVELQVTLVDARRSQRLVSFVVRSDAAAAANRRDAVLEAFERASAEAVLTIVARLREGSSAIQP